MSIGDANSLNKHSSKTISGMERTRNWESKKFIFHGSHLQVQ